MATICLHSFTSRLLALRIIFHQIPAQHSATQNSGSSQTLKKTSFTGVKEMKGNSQKGKYLQVLKNTSPEIKLN